MLGPKVENSEEELGPISRSIRSLTAELRDTLWAVDSGSDSLDDLLERMAQTARDMLGGHPSKLVFPATVPSIRLNMALRRNLVSILREALHNAIRHADASLITVRVELEAETLVLSVEDDGVGYDPATGSSGRGIETLRRRSKDSGGNLEIRSREGEGTVVRFSVRLTDKENFSTKNIG